LHSAKVGINPAGVRLMETRLTPAYEFKAADVQASGQFSGYASTFHGPPDAFGDVIAPGAFSASLAKHAQQGSAPALLWSHHPDEPIGRWLDMHEDQRGLAVTGALTLEVPQAKAAHALMRDGAVGLSIGFNVADDERSGDTRMLKEIDLWEVSCVSMPANPRAKITDVRAAITDIRRFETKLRDMGFSVREARKLADGGWRALTTSDSDELHDLARMLRTGKTLFED
jgi:hypothetical protein